MIDRSSSAVAREHATKREPTRGKEARRTAAAAVEATEEAVARQTGRRSLLSASHASVREMLSACFLPSFPHSGTLALSDREQLEEGDGGGALVTRLSLQSLTLQHILQVNLSRLQGKRF